MHEIATIGSIVLLNVVRSYSIVTMMLTICQKSPHRQRTNKLSDPKKEKSNNCNVDKNPYQNKSDMLLSKKAPPPKSICWYCQNNPHKNSQQGISDQILHFGLIQANDKCSQTVNKL